MKTAKIFKHGNSQAVRLPKEFRFDADEVLVKRSGGGVLLLPTGSQGVCPDVLQAGSGCLRLPWPT